MEPHDDDDDMCHLSVVELDALHPGSMPTVAVLDVSVTGWNVGT